ncbi:uncharacterized protein [Aegilops tauschii subsp. strangulata]|uniref:uncharacterized protein n=1 Tax=Aegilops tauschii subsp. strangulata TaxID=200361 RepID=UPI003CC88C20
MQGYWPGEVGLAARDFRGVAGCGARAAGRGSRRKPGARRGRMPCSSSRNLVLEEALKGEAFKKRYDEWMARYHRTYKEEAMKKRFEEWMAKYHRTYKDDEEKARRYELFKDCAKMVDKLNVFPGGATTNNFCDYSEDERQASLGAE